MKLSRIVASYVALAALGLSALVFAASSPTAGQPWDGYQSWYLVTQKPNTGNPTGFLKDKHGGIKAYRVIYINSVGEATNRGEAPIPYPEGTIVVKETYKNQAAYEKRSKPVLTIMVKLAQGTSPQTGDWEFYMDGDGKKHGHGTSKWGKFCGSCHFSAAPTDFVFMNHEFYAAHPDE